MPLRADWTTGYAPHRDRSTFDRTIASLQLDDEPIGYVAFKLDRRVTRTSGHLWWTKRSVPVDVVAWIEVLMPGTADETMQDGIAEVAELADQVRAGTWPVDHLRLRGAAFPRAAGGVVTLRFLNGGERDDAWPRFGWGDD